MAYLIITREKKGTICDSLGIFHLQIKQSDTLQITALGYQTKKWGVPFIFNATHPPFFQINMDEISYLLEEVDVYALGSWDDFKKDFVKMKIKEENPINSDIKKQIAPYNTKKPNPVPAIYRPKLDKNPGVLDAIFRPTDFLHAKLSKSEKAKRKIANIIKNENTTKKIEKRYNAQIVADVTGLSGEQLLDFMSFCGSRIKLTEHSTEYDAVKQILDNYQEYLSLQKESE